MTPQRSTLLALIGVLLAGIPLPPLTTARREAAAPAAESTQATLRTTYATLHWSGQPVELSLLHEGRELIHLRADELTATPWEGELTLPPTGQLDVEVSARWPEGGTAQAASLSLEPEGTPLQQSTRWTEPGSNTLHSLFSFTW